MKEQLDHQETDAFGENIAKVWELNKTLDPGTSNEKIEAVKIRFRSKKRINSAIVLRLPQEVDGL